MALTREDLSRVGIDMSPRDFERVIVAVVRELNAEPPALGPHQELTADELAALQEGMPGIDLRSEPSRAPLIAYIALNAALVFSGHTVAEVAQMLELSATDVRKRILGRQLLGVKVGREWRLPQFQFRDGDLVPGIDRVLPRFPVELPVPSIYNWMTHPDPDLEDDQDGSMSPLDWLVSGRDPSVVAELAGGLFEAW